MLLVREAKETPAEYLTIELLLSGAKRHDNKRKAQQTAKNEEADTKEVSRNLRRSPRLNSTTASVTTGPPKSEQDYFLAISLINSFAI